jgi:hypothetical protein
LLLEDLFLYFYSPFGIAGAWTQGVDLTRQELYTLNHTPSQVLEFELVRQVF